jgi:hypothetical protein
MKSAWIAALSTALLLSATNGQAQPSLLGAKAGEAYEITRVLDTSKQGTNGSTGSSHDQDVIVERVVGLRADGLELEYDLPSETPAKTRADQWQFPARVFEPLGGSLQLLNRPELEARVEAWLKAAKWTRAVCGHWIFTWNAFRIDCDPDSVVATIKAFGLGPSGLHEGVPYQAPEARRPVPIARKTSGPDGAIFTVELEVDPDGVRRSQAESDVVVGEIMHKPVILDTALRERAKEAVSGTISITFDTDRAGNVQRRTKVIKVEIKSADGDVETNTATETLTRRLLSGRAAHR